MYKGNISITWQAKHCIVCLAEIKSEKSTHNGLHRYSGKVIGTTRRFVPFHVERPHNPSPPAGSLPPPPPSVTVLTTPANIPFVSDFLSGTSAAVVSLNFPANVPGIPVGAESTDALPSMSLFTSFAVATELMRPDFERALESLSPRVSFLVSDGFLWWTQESAEKLGVPRLVFYGLSCHAMVVLREVAVSGAVLAVDSTLNLPSLPWMEVFDPVLRDPSLDPAHSEFVLKFIAATARSSGLVVNSFVEIESVFVEHWNREFGPKAWCVGPLCLAGFDVPEPRPEYLRWLDERQRVLYVAFGSQAEISAEQAAEIAKGLRESGVDFLWAVGKTTPPEISSERGFVVREWADQKKILRHRSVKGFLSHCGWNSVTESLSAEVPILAWPLAAEPLLNARNVTEELKIGARVVEAKRVKGFVTWHEIAKSVKDFMATDCEAVKVNAKRLAAAAREAVAEGGSSWKALEALVDQYTEK